MSASCNCTTLVVPPSFSSVPCGTKTREASLPSFQPRCSAQRAYSVHSPRQDKPHLDRCTPPLRRPPPFPGKDQNTNCRNVNDTLLVLTARFSRGTSCFQCCCVAPCMTRSEPEARVVRWA